MTTGYITTLILDGREHFAMHYWTRSGYSKETHDSFAAVALRVDQIGGEWE